MSRRQPKLNPVAPLDRLLIGPEDFAHVLSVSLSKFYEMVKDGTIPPPDVHFGNLPHWSVAKLLDEHRAFIGHAQVSTLIGSLSYDRKWGPDDNRKSTLSVQVNGWQKVRQLRSATYRDVCKKRSGLTDAGHLVNCELQNGTSI
jgi:predicted DNA-binding transcriptional regulator AlpA